MVVYNELPEVVGELIQRVSNLEARISKLELNQTNKPGRKPDEITIKIMEFLKQHSGVGFNSGSIAFGIKEKDSKIVSGRLKTLFGRGLIKAEKSEGLSAMYWYEDEQEDKS